MEISLPIYIVALDGDAPGAWTPFSTPLSEIASRLTPSKREISGLPTTVRTRLILRNLAALKAEDTPAIVGALVDGRDFCDDAQCPRLQARASELYDLAVSLAAHPTPFFSKYGFRIFLVCAEELQFSHKLEAVLQGPLQHVLRQKEPTLSLRLDMVENETVLLHMGKNLARTFASNLQAMRDIPGFAFEGGAA